MTLVQHGDDWLPGKFLTAADFGDISEGAASKTVLLDAQANPVVPNGSLGHRFTASGEGKWNLDLHGVDPLLTLHGTQCDMTAVKLPRFDSDRPGILTRGVPTRIVAGQRVTTVFDLVLAQYGVHRDHLPGDWPKDYYERNCAIHTGVAGADHRRTRQGGETRSRARIRRQC